MGEPFSLCWPCSPPSNHRSPLASHFLRAALQDCHLPIALLPREESGNVSPDTGGAGSRQAPKPHPALQEPPLLHTMRPQDHKALGVVHIPTTITPVSDKWRQC
jgi:hypothetical protein